MISNTSSQFLRLFFRISEDADYTAIGFVDSMLDIVSGGRYSKDREKEREREEKKTVPTTTATTTAADEKEVPMEVVVVAEGDNAEATSEVAAADQKKEEEEVELLKPAKEEEEEEVVEEESNDQAEQIQQALDEAKTLISELQAAQHRRLASAPEPVPPDERETELAEAVTSKLVAIIASSARPMDVVSVEALRRSMGVLVQEQDQVEEEVVDLEREPQSQHQQSQPSI